MKLHMIWFLSLLLLTIKGYAQIIDTVYFKSSEYIYYTVEKDSAGRKKGAICYYDTQERLRKSVDHNETVWYSYFEGEEYSYRVFKRNGKNQIINPEEFYDENNNLVATQEYKGERPVLRTFYDTLGNKRLDLPFKKGQIHGTSYSYHPNGTIEWTKSYKKGKLFGERTLRGSTGSLVTGENKYTFPYAKAPIITQCINGRPHGKFEVPFIDGGVSYTGQYDNGYPDGRFIYFDREGNVTKIDIYKKGKFKKSVSQ